MNSINWSAYLAEMPLDYFGITDRRPAGFEDENHPL